MDKLVRAARKADLIRQAEELELKATLLASEGAYRLAEVYRDRADALRQLAARLS